MRFLLDRDPTFIPLLIAMYTDGTIEINHAAVSTQAFHLFDRGQVYTAELNFWLAKEKC